MDFDVRIEQPFLISSKKNSIVKLLESESDFLSFSTEEVENSIEFILRHLNSEHEGFVDEVFLEGKSMLFRIISFESFLNTYISSLQFFSELSNYIVSIHLSFLNSQAACINKGLKHLNIAYFRSRLIHFLSFSESFLFLLHSFPHKLELRSLDWNTKSLDSCFKFYFAEFR